MTYAIRSAFESFSRNKTKKSTMNQPVSLDKSPVDTFSKGVDDNGSGSNKNNSATETTKKICKESNYWNNFYAKWDIGIPSQFCVLVATEADKSRPVVEFGCGNGRDSIYLARQGFQVFAGDLSEEAVNHNTQKEAGGEEDKKNTNHADFSVCDVANAKDVQALIYKAREQASDSGNGNLTLYNRFFLHSLDDEQERLFLTALSDATKTGDRLYMEFRCSLDADLDKLFKGHFRRYVETKQLVVLLDQLEFEVSYDITGQGMAKYKTEDPFVSRIIAERR